ENGRLVEVHQERSFTHLRRGLTATQEISADKIAEVVAVLAAQLEAARGGPGGRRRRRQGRRYGGGQAGRQPRHAARRGPERMWPRDRRALGRGGSAARLPRRGADARLRTVWAP